ncbi:hypothetical protein [Fibrobacter sp.]|nr:hypothetical protein [Fibrobacter sp.]MBO7060344.1 hypothetical protein [Fibrobacter sp.]MBO7105756.1 hypothetical protein [Fibrobacter sp.]
MPCQNACVSAWLSRQVMRLRMTPALPTGTLATLKYQMLGSAMFKQA